MPQSALAAALVTVLLGATAARALVHWSRMAVGAAAVYDALEPTLTRGRDRLQAHGHGLMLHFFSL